jgi:hypothetical protein
MSDISSFRTLTQAAHTNTTARQKRPDLQWRKKLIILCLLHYHYRTRTPTAWTSISLNDFSRALFN